MKHLPAPDFPTGGVIYGYGGVQEAYKTGRGRVVMRAKMHEEELDTGRTALIATELPTRSAIFSSMRLLLTW